MTVVSTFDSVSTFDLALKLDKTICVRAARFGGAVGGAFGTAFGCVGVPAVVHRLVPARVASGVWAVVPSFRAVIVPPVAPALGPCDGCPVVAALTSSLGPTIGGAFVAPVVPPLLSSGAPTRVLPI